MAEKKPQYSRPASQVDLEQRLASGNRSDRVLSTADNYEPRPEDPNAARNLKVEGNETDAYVNVDPVYQNYASETEAPSRAEGGPEADLEAVVLGEAVITPDGVEEKSEDKPEEKSDDKAEEKPKSPAAKTAASKES